MKPKQPGDDRPVKRILIVELTEAGWKRFLAVLRREGYEFINDPAGALAELPRAVGPDRPSRN